MGSRLKSILELYNLIGFDFEVDFFNELIVVILAADALCLYVFLAVLLEDHCVYNLFLFYVELMVSQILGLCIEF